MKWYEPINADIIISVNKVYKKKTGLKMGG